VPLGAWRGVSVLDLRASIKEMEREYVARHGQLPSKMSDLPPLLLAATREYARIRPTAQHEYTTLSVEHAAAGKEY